MIISNIKGVRLDSLVACVPSNLVNNEEYAKIHFDDDLTPVIKALGIRERHVAIDKDTTALTMCVEAARKLQRECAFSNTEIGAVIMVTTSPDYIMPNNATYAQYLLDIPRNVAAYDINHACPGFVFGLWNAALVCKNLQKKILLLDGDINTKYVSPYDKSTSLLFGDAGVACVLTPDDSAEEMNFAFMSDGSNRDKITVKLGFKNVIAKEMLEYVSLPSGGSKRYIDMEMDGAAVFDYVVNEVPQYVNDFMEELESEPAEFEHLILHQANAFMLKKLAKAIGFDYKTKVPMSIGKYGNTSSVSIPITIASELQSYVNRVLCVGMGAGLATGMADISLAGLKNYGVFETEL